MPSVRNSESKIYLSVSFGKLRQKTLNGKKVDADTENAVGHKTKDGTMSYAIEFDYVEGYIEGIKIVEHEKYGEFFELSIREPGDICCLTFKTNSPTFQDIMNYLPNVDFSKPIQIGAYSYTTKSGNDRQGINVIQENNPKTHKVEFKNGNSIQSVNTYYRKWDNDKWVFENGFPDSNGVDFNDKKQKTMYNLDLEEFLKKEVKRLFEGKVSKDQEKQIIKESKSEKSDENDERFPPMPDFDQPDEF